MPAEGSRVPVKAGGQCFRTAGHCEAMPSIGIELALERLSRYERAMILAGDIGGTNVRLALFELQDESVHSVAEQRWLSRELTAFGDSVGGFLGAQRAPILEAACFGVAGAVIDGRGHATNLPWVLEESSLSTLLGGIPVKLLNDVEATAFGMLHLPSTDLTALHPPTVRSRPGNIAVVAVGTGLGEGILYWDGKAYHPLPSEGGHSDFAPRTDREIELLRYMGRRLNGHVSYERVLSGPGLSNLYAFLRDSGFAPESAALRAQLQGSDPNALIARLGLEGTEPLCVAALELFCAILGAEAGNLALTAFALGGVYIAGGIPPKILPALQRETFWDAFIDKGRFKDLLRQLPVWVNLNQGAPLLGAAHYARRLAARR